MLLVRMRRLGVLLFLALVPTGCGQAPTIPVRGIVKLDNRPLADASVLFIAQDADGRDARGSTDADGVFQLSTFQNNDGAMKGKYKVVVQPPAETRKGPPAATPLEAQNAAPSPVGPERTPPRFSLADQTPLVQEIPTGKEIVFDLKSK